MRLLALYIESYRDLFRKLCINFTHDYYVSFEDNILSVKKLESAAGRDGFYGENISDISVIIGQNGTGKTSIMDIIGELPSQVLSTLDLKKTGESSIDLNDSYFLLFLNDEGKYFIEITGDKITFENLKSVSYIEEASCSFFIEEKENQWFEAEKEIKKVEWWEDEPEPRKEYLFYLKDEQKRMADRDIEVYSEIKKNDKGYLVRKNRDDSVWRVWHEVYSVLVNKGFVKRKKVKLQLNLDYIRPVRRFKNFQIRYSISGKTTSDLKKQLILYSPDRSEFFSQYLSVAMDNFISAGMGWTLSASDLDNEKECDNIPKMWDFVYKYNRKAPDSLGSAFTIDELFDDLNKFLKNGKKFYDAYDDDRELLNELVECHRKLFLTLYNANDKIVFGGEQIVLYIDSEAPDENIINILEAYSELKKLEAYIAEKNDLKDYHAPVFLDIVPGLSQGERKFVSMVSGVVSCIAENILTTRIGDFSLMHHYIILIDEVEEGMHLEWSRKFIGSLESLLGKTVKMITDRVRKKLGLIINKDPQFRLQLIMTTHSPFLISDLLPDSVIELEHGDDGFTVLRDRCSNMFSQNIQNIISDNFYVNKYCGDLAIRKVNYVIEKLNSEKPLDEKETENIKFIINNVGDSLIRRKLKAMMDNKYHR